jgi:hypothetical protein
MKPSRTYTIAVFGVTAELLVGAATVAIAIASPESMAAAAEVLSTVSLAIGGAAGLGSASMAARDYGSGGLTSSQGDIVAGAR